MNVAEAFATYLTTLTSSTLGQDLFIGEAPSSNKVDTDIYWIIASGGPVNKRITGQTGKQYSISLYFRSRDYKTVYDTIFALEETLNCASCVELTGYDTIDISATVLGIDDDLDLEDRKVGLLQIVITVEACL